MLLYAQFGILVLLGVLDVWFGIVKGAFFSVWWWDIPMHFLGGIWVGLFVAWLLGRYNRKNKNKSLIVQCATIALAIGIGWEIFEYAFGIGGSIFMSYWADTIKDLCMDTLGGAAAGAAAYFGRNLWRK